MKEETLVPISALQHFSFCARQCGLIHLEQCFDENALTIRGHAVHARVDTPESTERGEKRIENSLPLFSDRYGLIGKADLIEFSMDGTAYPVEYKHGKRAEKIHDEIQLAAQAICLEEMTKTPVPLGAIYYFSSRRRREVEITEALKNKTILIIEDVRKMLDSMKLPPPVNDSRCRNCSLIDLCQPSIIGNQLSRKQLGKQLFSDTNQ